MLRSTTVFFLALTVIMLCNACGRSSDNSSGEREIITLSGAFALYPLANIWAEKFSETHPNVRFNISAGGAGKGMADALASAVDLGMVSRAVKDEEIAIGAWPLAVTKDAVIPTINAKNPLLQNIKTKGVKQDEFRKIFITGEIQSWKQLVNTTDNEKINVYTRSDAAGAAATWAQYLGGKEQDALKAIGVFGDPGLAEAVKNDLYGVGFNNIIFLYDLDSKQKYPGIEVIPIDVNGDGSITPDESFYQDLNQLTAAIGDGRFPSPPARELYLVSKGKPQRPVVNTFLKWILTEGQQYVSDAGYITLSEEKVKSEISKLETL